MNRAHRRRPAVSAPLLRQGTLKTCPGLSHGLLTVNAELLAFVRA